MLTILFMVLMLWIFGKLFLFSVRAAWGLGKIILTVLFLPAILIMMVLGGLLSVAFPILIVVGIVSLLCGKNS